MAMDHIYTRQEWQAARDKAGGKAGMVKGVDIGPLLDAYHKATANPSTIVASRNGTKQTYALIQGLKKYRAHPTVTKTLALRDSVDNMIKAIDQHVKDCAEAERRLTELKGKLESVTDETRKIEQVRSLHVQAQAKLVPLHYKRLKTATNEVGTALRRLNDKDSVVDEMYHKWLNITGRRLSAGGSDADPEEIKKAIDAAAVIAELTKKMLDGLRAKQLVT